MLRAILIVAASVIVLVLAWFMSQLLKGPEPVATYNPWGPQPGDLSPGIDVSDNVQNYGIDQDIPYRFTTNSLGFRGPEPKSNGDPTIVLLGDSFLFGMGVNDDDTFSVRLAAALESEFPDLVVHNAGVPGYSGPDQLEQWRDKLNALKPDLVLVCHTASDLREMARPTSFRRLTKYDEDIPERTDPEITKLLEQAEEEANDKAPWIFTEEELKKRLCLKFNGEIKRFQKAYTHTILSLARAVAPARPGVILWVDGYGVGQLTTQPLEQALSVARIPYFEGDKQLRAQRKVAPEELFLPDKHFSARGNALAAEQTAAWLLREKLLDKKSAPGGLQEVR